MSCWHAGGGWPGRPVHPAVLRLIGVAPGRAEVGSARARVCRPGSRRLDLPAWFRGANPCLAQARARLPIECECNNVPPVERAAAGPTAATETQAMHRVDRSILVPYSPAQMFDLVRDVASYPQFLPWCPSTRVVPGPQPEVIEARVDIAYLGVHSHFTTRNEHVFPREIRLTLLDGPFRELRGVWRFAGLGEHACKVTLELEYGFSAGLLGRAIAPVFEKVANSLIDAFAARAQALYGESQGGF